MPPPSRTYDITDEQNGSHPNLTQLKMPLFNLDRSEEIVFSFCYYCVVKQLHNDAWCYLGKQFWLKVRDWADEEMQMRTSLLSVREHIKPHACVSKRLDLNMAPTTWTIFALKSNSANREASNESMLFCEIRPSNSSLSLPLLRETLRERLRIGARHGN